MQNIFIQYILIILICHRRKFYAWYCQPSQKPISREVTGPRVEPAIAALLNAHAVKLSSKHLRLYPYMRNVLNLGQRSFISAGEISQF